MPPSIGEPALSFLFSVTVDGPEQIDGYFTEISGIETEYEVIEHKTVDVHGRVVVQQVPGRPKWSPITLKRGITHSMGFWQWHRKVGLGFIEQVRAQVSIVMYNRHYEPLVQWDLQHAWPTKVSGPRINSSGDEIAVEEVTLIHEGITFTSLGGAGGGGNASQQVSRKPRLASQAGGR